MESETPVTKEEKNAPRGKKPEIHPLWSPLKQ